MTKQEYKEAKQKCLEFELRYLATFYGKVIYTDLKTSEPREEYFTSLNEMIKYCLQLTEYKIEFRCEPVTQHEWDENYLPF